MGYIRGANTVLDKLVLALDAGNDKSFRDEPTTNQVSGADNPDNGWGSRVHITVPYVDLPKGDGFNQLPRDYYGYKMNSTSNADTWSGNAYSYSQITNYSCAADTKYSVSVYCYVSIDFNGEWARIVSEGAANIANYYDTTKKGTWQRLTFTFTPNSAGNVYCYLYWSKYGVTDFSTLTGYVIFYAPQFEQKDNTSAFVNGSRGTTVATGGGWRDLSGYENHGITVGNIISEVDISRCYNFSGATGAYSSESTEGFSFEQNMVQRTGDFTFNCWVKNLPLEVGQNGLFSNAGGGDGYRLGVGCNGIYYLVGPPYVEGWIEFSTPLLQTLWYNISTVFNRTSNYVDLYLNGEYVSGVTIPANQTAATDQAPGIVKSSCCGIYQGKLAVFNVYNKALSPSEIKQNYNALKSRFNLE